MRRTWLKLRTISPILISVAGVIWTIFLITTPLYKGWFGNFLTNSFIIFILFWTLAVLLTLMLNSDRRKPWKSAFLSVCGCATAWVVYMLVWHLSEGVYNFSDIAFASATGAVLGALAGTWGIYFLEVYLTDIEGF